uniref:Putative polyprotein n=1 Tax=Albugo laibachii Nc14 TaxID=890382 RepID=F0WYD1_9STRA|nr:putative polyprotein [Albugo laibachii Nc14]|eukprot:CCA26484.1 putative polyprotein [Albugo laibachii Nc14]
MRINYTDSDKKLCVCAYSDADSANNKESRRSVSGIMVMINGAPVIFKSKIQQSVAHSTAEAEYIALSLCVQEVLWLKSLLCELKAKISQQIKIFEYNQSAIAIAKNDGYQSRANYIDIHYHFIHDHIKDGKIVIEYIDSKNQPIS